MELCRVMSLTSKEAAETLSDVERATRRSAQAFGYRKASPHLVIWGLAWFVGYTGTDLWPHQSGLVWLGVIVAGMIASTIAGSRMGRGEAGALWRTYALIAVFIVFISGTYAVMWPVGGLQQGAFIPLLVGAIYAGVGIWLGLRLLITGVAIMAPNGF